MKSHRKWERRSAQLVMHVWAMAHRISSPAHGMDRYLHCNERASRKNLPWIATPSNIYLLKVSRWAFGSWYWRRQPWGSTFSHQRGWWIYLVSASIWLYSLYKRLICAAWSSTTRTTTLIWHAIHCEIPFGEYYCVLYLMRMFCSSTSMMITSYSSASEWECKLLVDTVHTKETHLWSFFSTIPITC